MGDTFIRHIALLGFEKRFVPSQHYVSSGAACQARVPHSAVLSPPPGPPPETGSPWTADVGGTGSWANGSRSLGLSRPIRVGAQ